MRNSKFWSASSKRLALLGLLTCSQWSQAVVNIDCTRVIFTTGKSNATFNLINEKSDKPTLVQVWIDDGDPTEAPEQIKSPVIVPDPIFRLNSNEQRNVRLILPDSSKIPTDRETVYWLNVLQIPAIKKIQTDQQRIVLPLRFRLKLFIRPKGILAPTEADMQLVKFTQTPTALLVNNPTPWNITFVNLHMGKQKFNDFMAPAKSQYSLKLTQPLQNDGLIEAGIVNDHGTQWPFKAHLSLVK